MKTLAIIPVAACVLALAACGVTTSVSHASSPAAAKSTRLAAPSSSPSPTGNTTGSVGDTATFTDSTDGWSYSATLVKVVDPAQPDNSFDAADSGKRLVGAEFVLKGLTGNATDDANSDAVIQGSDRQLYQPSFGGLAAGTNFDSGTFSLTPGSTETGWVAFEVPDGVKVAKIQWNPSLVSSPVTWVVTP